MIPQALERLRGSRGEECGRKFEQVKLSRRYSEAEDATWAAVGGAVRSLCVIRDISVSAVLRSSMSVGRDGDAQDIEINTENIANTKMTA